MLCWRKPWETLVRCGDRRYGIWLWNTGRTMPVHNSAVRTPLNHHHGEMEKLCFGNLVFFSTQVIGLDLNCQFYLIMKISEYFCDLLNRPQSIRTSLVYGYMFCQLSICILHKFAYDSCSWRGLVTGKTQNKQKSLYILDNAYYCERST